VFKRDVSELGVAFIAQHEGLRRKVYLDVGGLETIGVGHLLTRGEKTSRNIVINGQECLIDQGLSVQQCHQLLRQDLQNAVEIVNRSVHNDLGQNEFDALVSFVFNVGGRAFRQSSLLRRVNFGMFGSVPAEFRKWIYVKGVKSEGLRRRREAEAKLWFTGDYGLEEQ